MEYERLRKMDHKMCKNRNRIHVDNRIRSIEGNNKDKQIRNAYKEIVSLKAGFQPHADLCRGTNNEILSKEEKIKTRWKTYFQDLLTSPARAAQSNTLEANYTNQVDTVEELEEELPDIMDIEMAVQSVNNNKLPDIENIHVEVYKKGVGCGSTHIATFQFTATHHST